MFLANKTEKKSELTAPGEEDACLNSLSPPPPSPTYHRIRCSRLYKHTQHPRAAYSPGIQEARECIAITTIIHACGKTTSRGRSFSHPFVRGVRFFISLCCLERVIIRTKRSQQYVPTCMHGLRQRMTTSVARSRNREAARAAAVARYDSRGK